MNDHDTPVPAPRRGEPDPEPIRPSWLTLVLSVLGAPRRPVPDDLLAPDLSPDRRASGPPATL